MSETHFGRISAVVLCVVTLVFILTKVGGIALVALLVVDFGMAIGVPLRRYWLAASRGRSQ
jgi:hypothetical protein